MVFRWIQILIGSLTLFWSVNASAQSCYAPSWRTVSDPVMGVTLSSPFETYITYGRLGEFVGYNRNTRGGSRPVQGPCSSFSYSFTDFGGKTINNVNGLYDAEQARLLAFMPGTRLNSSTNIRVDGLPARDIVYTIYIRELGQDSIRRAVLVARVDRLYSFNWHWDPGPTPADMKPVLSSIRFTPVAADANWRSKAMLSMAITEYWRYHPYESRQHFTPALKAQLQPRRASDAAIVKAFGFFFEEGIQFQGTRDGFRIFRIKHDNALVDWFVKDDGRYITAIRWQKL